MRENSPLPGSWPALKHRPWAVEPRCSPSTRSSAAALPSIVSKARLRCDSGQLFAATSSPLLLFLRSSGARACAATSGAGALSHQHHCGRSTVGFGWKGEARERWRIRMEMWVRPGSRLYAQGPRCTRLYTVVTGSVGPLVPSCTLSRYFPIQIGPEGGGWGGGEGGEGMGGGGAVVDDGADAAALSDRLDAGDHL